MFDFLKNIINRIKINKTKVAYIHIPKTGGTYLAQLETADDPVIWPLKYLGHNCVAQNPGIVKNYPPKVGFKDKKVFVYDDIKKYFLVATVRNIFSWLVSYAGHAGGWNPKYRDLDHYDYANAQKGVDYLVKTIANREDIWPNKKFIHFPIFSYEGDLVVDWLTRTETLDRDLKKLADFKKIKFNKKPKQRVGNIHVKDYREFYNDNLIELVYKTWGRELKLFGYSFDGLDIDKAILKKIITLKNKKEIKYFWEKDELIINNKIFR